jgi:hypothetical protein
MKDIFELHFDIRKKYTPKKDKDLVSTEVALRKASAAGRYKDAVILVANIKGTINQPGAESGKTALHQAALHGHASIYQLLEQNGASAAITDSANKNPEQYAKEFSHEEILTQHKKYRHYFSPAFQVILNQIVLGYLGYADITKSLRVSRSVYKNSYLFQYRKALDKLSQDIVNTQITSTPYHLLLSKIEFAELLKRDTFGWAKGKFPFDIPPVLLDNKFFVMFLVHDFISHDSIQKLMKDTQLFKLICTRAGLVLLAKGILDDRNIQRILNERDPALLSALLSDQGVRELLYQCVTIDSIWDKRVELKQLIAKFWPVASFARALELVEAGRHLDEPAYDFLGDLTNSPW